MPFHRVTGDPLLTHCDYLAIGHNARGNTEHHAVNREVAQRFPAAMSQFERKAKRGKLTAGTWFLWTESTPRLLIWAVRDSHVGATRLRYIQSLVLQLARDYVLYNIESLAIAPLGTPLERDEILLVMQQWLNPVAIPIFAYTEYQAGVAADESL